ERHNNKITLLHFANAGADCFDDTDGFMTHASTVGSWFQVVIWPKITAADASASDPKQRIRGLFDTCVGNGFNANIAGPIHDCCTHNFNSVCQWVLGFALYCSSVTFSIQSTGLPFSAS